MTGARRLCTPALRFDAPRRDKQGSLNACGCVFVCLCSCMIVCFLSGNLCENGMNLSVTLHLPVCQMPANKAPAPHRLIFYLHVKHIPTHTHTHRNKDMQSIQKRQHCGCFHKPVLGLLISVSHISESPAPGLMPNAECQEMTANTDTWSMMYSLFVCVAVLHLWLWNFSIKKRLKQKEMAIQFHILDFEI